jgi:hypothetical protein
MVFASIVRMAPAARVVMAVNATQHLAWNQTGIVEPPSHLDCDVGLAALRAGVLLGDEKAAHEIGFRLLGTIDPGCS